VSRSKSADEHRTAEGNVCFARKIRTKKLARSEHRYRNLDASPKVGIAGQEKIRLHFDCRREVKGVWRLEPI
jgi:hypothetical protein